MLEFFKKILRDRKKAREAKLEIKIKEIWSEKTDEQILESYEDAMEWSKICDGTLRMLGRESCMREQTNQRLENYILPEMTKRKLFKWKKCNGR